MYVGMYVCMYARTRSSPAARILLGILLHTLRYYIYCIHLLLLYLLYTRIRIAYF